MSVPDAYLKIYTEMYESTPGDAYDAKRAAVGAITHQVIRDLAAGRIPEEVIAAAGCDTAHVVDLREDGWTIRHPLSCRPHLFTCPVNRAAERDLTEPPEIPGQYMCGLDDAGRFTIHALVDEAAEATERAL